MRKIDKYHTALSSRKHSSRELNKAVTLELKNTCDGPNKDQKLNQKFGLKVRFSKDNINEIIV